MQGAIDLSVKLRLQAVSSMTVGPQVTNQLPGPGNSSAAARTIIYTHFSAAYNSSAAHPLTTAEYINVTLWCGPDWERTRSTAEEALAEAADELSNAAVGPMPLPPEEGEDSSNGQLRDFVIGTFVLACVGMHPLSPCIWYNR